MRSSKSRSRSKQNRPRTIGNIVNRVFDSSGPEGKVRGTPQQIIEKYQALARDAQLSNDRVAAENFLQHAEHYTRMLGEAMREMALEQEARRQHQGGNDRGYAPRRDERDEEQPDVGAGAYGFTETTEEGESVLVETPEAQPQREPRYDNRRRDENRGHENRGHERRDDNRRYDAPRRDDRRDENRRDDRRDDNRRDETRRDERRDDNRPYNKRPRREDERRNDEAVVTEAPAAVAPTAEENAARPVLSIEKPRAPKPAPRPAAEEAPQAVAFEAPAAAEGDLAEKPKRPRAPRKPREPKTEAAE